MIITEIASVGSGNGDRISELIHFCSTKKAPTIKIWTTLIRRRGRKLNVALRKIGTDDRLAHGAEIFHCIWRHLVQSYCEEHQNIQIVANRSDRYPHCGVKRQL